MAGRLTEVRVWFGMNRVSEMEEYRPNKDGVLLQMQLHPSKKAFQHTVVAETIHLWDFWSRFSPTVAKGFGPPEKDEGVADVESQKKLAMHSATIAGFHILLELVRCVHAIDVCRVSGELPQDCEGENSQRARAGCVTAFVHVASFHHDHHFRFFSEEEIYDMLDRGGRRNT
uniref:Uncharacterized protein n=1 Tax=Oryza sativa subsp. japonica TaxID=39947 RepID=Q69MJ6_ORYSJ|nr:hypothetical protein [Oryza sativa Japonica Group]BAD33919.1 hypothetical protein [Oryza sativa Japonica Group]